MFTALETHLIALIHILPLPWFALCASFIEEVIVPIPSPFIMLTAGSVARLQGISGGEIALLAFIGAVGKTVGALCIYWIADKAEDLLLGKYSRFFGVTHRDVERLGARFSGTPRDYALMIFFRSLPVVPSALVSIGSGLLKLPLPLFVAGTFIGTIIRDGIYLYVGYAGTETLHRIIIASKNVEDMMLLAALLGICAVCALWYLRKRRSISRP
jgi:membrane protein DedA with SNARE-associated domain